MSFPRYPKYKPSGVEWLGEVPQHWHVATPLICERQGASRRFLFRRFLFRRRQPPAASAVPLTEARP